VRVDSRHGPTRQIKVVDSHVSSVPGLMIFLVTLGSNILGGRLREALDPRPRQ
jgi:ABC-type dipeptide/oligopeptide/nickel transport system permease subunit